MRVLSGGRITRCEVFDFILANAPPAAVGAAQDTLAVLAHAALAGRLTGVAAAISVTR